MDKIIGAAVLFILLFFTFALVTGCAAVPPDVNVNVLCAQPPAGTLSEGELLPAAPFLDGANPSGVIGELSLTLREDEVVHGRELDKRRELVEFGVAQCGWTR